MANILAIVGRPNVGKSTFFNRLCKQRKAIEDPTSGVTRDRHYGKADWNGVYFSIIDTGGYVVGSDDIFEEEIRKQATIAIEEADAIVFLVDVKDGLTPLDEEVAKILHRSNKKVFLSVNKVDNNKLIADSSEFYSLNLGTVYPISAINGSGTGELLDDVVKVFDKELQEVVDDDVPRFAVVGRPNVGKSSLINALIGNNRNIVTDIAGTTRDSIDTEYNAFGFHFKIIDTAGIRKKAKIKENIEFYSNLRSIRTIEDCNVGILLIDAVQGFESQDQNIFSLLQRNHKGIVIVVNKWDLVEKDSNTHLQFSKSIREKLAPFTDVPIIFTSVLEKQRILKVFQEATAVFERRKLKITTSKLNESILEIVHKTPPPMYKGKSIKIKYVTQLPIAYPAFAIFCNLPQYIRDPYKRFLENKLRGLYNFSGVPIEIYFRKK
ncbi:MAG TPA: ribosome biogenesis GTPase Der [Bacteroidetes bacterium]|nr:ribosome biogenesis GTPase Der [Bacteroidota bacterium]